MKRRLRGVVFWTTLLFLLASCTATPDTGSQVRPVAPETPSQQAAGAPPLAVLGAVYPEVTLLRSMLTDTQTRQIEGIEFISGRLGAQPVVLAWTGVGKVNAAMTATLLLEHFRPERVLFTGIAGGVDPNLEPGDIVIAQQTAYHDMGTLSSAGIDYGGVKSRLTGEPNPVFFPADPVLLAAARQTAKEMTFGALDLRTGQRAPHVVVGTVVTGDVFVASPQKGTELAEKLGACAVEMEGAAVAQICYQRHVGCLVIRSISDKADRSAVMDKQLFHARAAQNSAGLVIQILSEGLKRGTE